MGRAADLLRAADELIDSRWFSQTGRRARHHVDVLRALARSQH